jgi:TnpA family transposase
MLGFRFCPRLRDFPDRRFASFETPSAYADLETLMGKRIKADISPSAGMRSCGSLRPSRPASSRLLRC